MWFWRETFLRIRSSDGLDDPEFAKSKARDRNAAVELIESQSSAAFEASAFKEHRFKEHRFANCDDGTNRGIDPYLPYYPTTLNAQDPTQLRRRRSR